MKKNETSIGRILGRKLARELTREELEQATGSGPKTTTFRYPPDQDQIDPGN